MAAAKEQKALVALVVDVAAADAAAVGVGVRLGVEDRFAALRLPFVVFAAVGAALRGVNCLFGD